jgi:hypothetical protein
VVDYGKQLIENTLYETMKARRLHLVSSSQANNVSGGGTALKSETSVELSAVQGTETMRGSGGASRGEVISQPPGPAQLWSHTACSR